MLAAAVALLLGLPHPALSMPCTGLGGVAVGDCGAGPGGAPQPDGEQPTSTTTSTTAPPSTTTTTVAPREKTAEEAGTELLRLLNEERERHELPPLSPRADVEEIASGHSRRMADEGELRHNDEYFTAASRRRLGAQRLGENVALNESIEDAHRRLMASDGHRAIILDPEFTVVGLGLVHDGLAWWITQDFVAPR